MGSGVSKPNAILFNPAIVRSANVFNMNNTLSFNDVEEVLNQAQNIKDRAAIDAIFCRNLVLNKVSPSTSLTWISCKFAARNRISPKEARIYVEIIITAGLKNTFDFEPTEDEKHGWKTVNDVYDFVATKHLEQGRTIRVARLEL